MEHTLKIHFLLRNKNLGCKFLSDSHRSHFFYYASNPLKIFARYFSLSQRKRFLVYAPFRPIQARFHYVSGTRHPLDSRVKLTRWIVLQKARRHPHTN